MPPPFSGGFAGGIFHHHINQGFPPASGPISREYYPTLNHGSYGYGPSCHWNDRRSRPGSRAPSPNPPSIFDNKPQPSHNNVALRVRPSPDPSLLTPTDSDDSLVDVQPRDTDARSVDGQTGPIPGLKPKPGLTSDGRSHQNNDDRLDIVKCRNVLSEVQGLVQPGRDLRFDNISPREHTYIEGQLKNLEIRARPAYFRDLEQFIVTMTHDVHEALVVPFINGMSYEFTGAPLERGPYSIFVDVSPNASVDCKDSKFIPDLCVRIFSLTGPGDLTAFREYIFMETAFSQSEADVTMKLEAYVKHHPHTLAVFKIRVKEAKYTTPSPTSTATMRYIGRPVLSEEQFRPARPAPNNFTVVRDGITWINVTRVSLELWLRLGETPIDLRVNQPGHAQTAYATGTLYPTRSTAALDALIDRTMKEFKKIIIQYAKGIVSFTPSESNSEPDSHDLNEEEKQAWLDDISSWTPRSPLFNWNHIFARLTTSMWKTAHDRYKSWHVGLPKRPLSEVDSDGEEPNQGDGPTNGSGTTSGSGPANKRVHRG